MTNTQHKNILKHLKTAKGLTVREALIEYSISSLTKRVHELRGLGYDIESVRKKHPCNRSKIYTLLSTRGARAMSMCGEIENTENAIKSLRAKEFNIQFNSIGLTDKERLTIVNTIREELLEETVRLNKLLELANKAEGSHRA
ncbi:gp10 [Roseobacter phage SIO1]|uniref:Gp10 n=1 Tax=Roseobacter phage SIO1 TaxID=2905867 RepID=Q9G0H5_9CAUD|nr:gp10 [Roseobacter phage SIO1]AAG02593.1 gp10 [Roseobacter phage SIO1]